MSTKKKKISPDRTQVKSFIQQYYGTYKDFCNATGINLGSFSAYMVGVETMPAIDAKVRAAMKANDYPVAFAENPNIEKQVHKSLIKAQAGEDTNEEIMPGVRMQFDATAS